MNNPNQSTALTTGGGLGNNVALEKLNTMERLWHEVGAVGRFGRAVMGGQYDKPWTTIVLGMVSLVYLISPVDFIPDVLPIIGLVDDATVMAFFMASFKRDLGRFVQWEANQTLESQTIDVTVEESA